MHDSSRQIKGQPDKTQSVKPKGLTEAQAQLLGYGILASIIIPPIAGAIINKEHRVKGGLIGLGLGIVLGAILAFIGFSKSDNGEGL